MKNGISIFKVIGKLMKSLHQKIEMKTCVIDDEECLVLKEFELNGTEYMCFVPLKNKKEFFFRKTVIEDGEEYICGLDDENEFMLVYNYFIKELPSDFENL